MKQSRMKWSWISGVMDFGIWLCLCVFRISKEREIELVEWESSATVRCGRDERFGNASSRPGRVCRFASECTDVAVLMIAFVFREQCKPLCHPLAPLEWQHDSMVNIGQCLPALPSNKVATPANKWAAKWRSLGRNVLSHVAKVAFNQW